MRQIETRTPPFLPLPLDHEELHSTGSALNKLTQTLIKRASNNYSVPELHEPPIDWATAAADQVAHLLLSAR